VTAFHFIPPCSPIRAKEVPAGDGWLHELKFDGYRVQVHKVGSRVIVYSRNGHDFTECFPSIAQLLHELPAKAAVLDGEVVASDADGASELRQTACAGPGRALSTFGHSTCSPSTGKTSAHSRL
jgi:bifunctional non-homologous end joining protein LigD